MSHRILIDQGTLPQLSYPYAHEHGVAEQKHCHIMDIAQSLL